LDIQLGGAHPVAQFGDVSGGLAASLVHLPGRADPGSPRAGQDDRNTPQIFRDRW
jgi:hypothetical protein